MFGIYNIILYEKLKHFRGNIYESEVEDFLFGYIETKM